MPIFKLSDRKDKSERVVSGIRLGESKYIDPNTAKIEVKSLKREEAEPIVQGALEEETPPEVISLPDEVNPVQSVPATPETERQKPDTAESPLSPEAKKGAPGIGAMPFGKKPMMPMGRRPVPSSGPSGLKRPMMPPGGRTPFPQIGRPKPMPPAGIDIKPSETTTDVKDENPDVLTPPPAEAKEQAALPNAYSTPAPLPGKIPEAPQPTPPPPSPGATVASGPEAEKLQLPKPGEPAINPELPEDEGILKLPTPSAASEKKPEEPKPSETPAATPEAKKPQPTFGKMPPDKKPLSPLGMGGKMPLGKKPLGAFGSKFSGVRPPLSQIGKPKPMPSAPGGAETRPTEKAQGQEAEKSGIDKNNTPPVTAVRPGSTVSQTLPDLKVPDPTATAAKKLEKPDEPTATKATDPLKPQPGSTASEKTDDAITTLGTPSPLPAAPAGTSQKPVPRIRPAGSSGARPAMPFARKPMLPGGGRQIGFRPPGRPTPTAQKTSDEDDNLIAPTTVLPANERADKLMEISAKPKDSSLYCFVKIAGTWKRKHFLPAQRGVRIGGASSINEITLNDNSLDNEQAVMVKAVDKWVVMDIGSKDMMRVDGTPSRQVCLSPNLPYVLQLGSDSVVVFLADANGEAPELIPPEKKPGTPPGAPQLSKLKFGEKEFPVFIPDKLPAGEDKEIKNLGSPCFTMTPTNDPDNVLQTLKIPAGSPPMLVGRSSKLSQLLVPDKNVSRRHAEISISGKSLTVKDCGTSNGTYVNFTEISGHAVVKAGETVTFGSIPFIVTYE
ncbi:MAG: FHA domain-containing protein [Victivallales bacterium]|nr:FHA domain-containing protein [Victivallales bacterium]